jgi:hypothetical protein
VAAARKASSRYFRSVTSLRTTRPRSQIATIYTMQGLFTYATPKCYFSRAGGFPRAPATVPPVCIPFVGTLFIQRLLTAHRKPGLCVVCLPAMSHEHFSAP